MLQVNKRIFLTKWRNLRLYDTKYKAMREKLKDFPEDVTTWDVIKPRGYKKYLFITLSSEMYLYDLRSKCSVKFSSYEYQ